MRSTALAWLGFVSLVLACATADDTSDGADTGAAGSSGAETSTSATGSTGEGAADSSSGEATPTFVEDVWPILDASCNCHISPPPGAPGLDTDFFMGSDPAGAYDSVIDQPSSVAGLDLVEPGRSADSYLYLKVDGTFPSVGGIGTVMPPGGMLSADDLATIARWIDGGAPE